MPGYINILQGKVARFEQNTTPSNVTGFFTDGLVSCCVVVFSGQKDGKRRISAFHSDSYLLNNDKQRLQEEMQWVGHLESFCIYRDPSYSTDNPHPMRVFSKDNQLQVEEIYFDARNKDQTELFISFDQSIAQKGYTHKVFTPNNHQELIFNHENAAKIYAYYKLNVMMQEVHSNNIFDQKSRLNPTLTARWNSGEMTFAERRSMTRDSNSLPEHNLVIFDGQRFTTPGKHDLSLTTFATQFFENYKKIDLNAQRIKQIVRDIQGPSTMFSKPIPNEQAAIISLMQEGDSSIKLKQRDSALQGVLNQSGAICDLYLFIKHNLSLDVVKIVDTRKILENYLINVKTLSSTGAEFFKNSDYINAMQIFETTLEYSKLCFYPESNEMGTAYHNLGAALHEHAMATCNNVLLEKAQIHLDLALKIRIKNGDTPNQQKTQNRLTKITLEPIRRMHSIMAAADLDDMTIENPQRIAFHNLYTFLSPTTGAAEVNLTTQAIEMYAAYASRTAQLAFPIFSMTDYGRENIRYCAFLIKSGSQRSNAISAIALYDNYETESSNQMKLRFFLQAAIVNDDDFYKTNLEKVNETVIESLLNHGFSVDKQSAKIPSDFYLCPFIRSPIQSTYEILANRTYPHDECIIRRVNPTLLTASKWQSMPRLLDANGNLLLGNEFPCFRFIGVFDEEVQAIANQNSRFLKNENHYDFATKITKENAGKHNTYLITNQDYTLCIGAFVFYKTENCDLHSEVLGIKKMYLEKMQNKQLNNQQMEGFLTEKISKNQHKKNDNEAKGGMFNRYRYSSESPYDTAVIKYTEKQANYQDMLFYWRLKTNINEKLQANKEFQYELQVAWIHPFYRRKGLLSKIWPEFQRHYGVFLVDTPSEAMQNFIDKKSIPQAGHCFGPKLIIG